MAELTKTNNTSAGSSALATIQPGNEHKIGPDLAAGENIESLDACYIKSDGKVWLSTGAAATAAAVVHGFAMQRVKIGNPITLYDKIMVGYSDATLTPGANLYLSGTVAGGVADAASTGGVKPIGYAVDSQRAVLHAQDNI